MEADKAEQSEKLYWKNQDLGRRQKELMNAGREDMMRFCHDLKQNMIYLSNLLKHQEYEKMQEVLSYLTGTVREIAGFSGETGNLAIDTMIGSLVSECREKNILLHLKTDLNGEPELHDTEFCSLLGNLFDNAVEASEKLESEREIWVDFSYRKGYLLLEVKNRYDKDAVLRKPGGCCGEGLKSVKDVTDRHSGHLRIAKNGALFRVRVAIFC